MVINPGPPITVALFKESKYPYLPTVWLSKVLPLGRLHIMLCILFNQCWRIGERLFNN
jgi:hypothetical protein